MWLPRPFVKYEAKLQTVWNGARYVKNGAATRTSVLRSLIPSSVFGSRASLSSARNTFSVFWLRVGLAWTTGRPTRSAEFSFGRAVGRTSIAGRKRFDRSVKSTRNGRWTRKLAIAASSVGGPFAIVAWRAAGLLPIAWKVSAMSAKSWAWTAATGAT